MEEFDENIQKATVTENTKNILSSKGAEKTKQWEINPGHFFTCSFPSDIASHITFSPSFHRLHPGTRNTNKEVEKLIQETINYGYLADSHKPITPSHSIREANHIEYSKCNTLWSESRQEVNLQITYSCNNISSITTEVKNNSSEKDAFQRSIDQQVKRIFQEKVWFAHQIFLHLIHPNLLQTLQANSSNQLHRPTSNYPFANSDIPHTLTN